MARSKSRARSPKHSTPLDPPTYADACDLPPPYNEDDGLPTYYTSYIQLKRFAAQKLEEVDREAWKVILVGVFIGLLFSATLVYIAVLGSTSTIPEAPIPAPNKASAPVEPLTEHTEWLALQYFWHQVRKAGQGNGNGELALLLSLESGDEKAGSIIYGWVDESVPWERGEGLCKVVFVAW